MGGGKMRKDTMMKKGKKSLHNLKSYVMTKAEKSQNEKESVMVKKIKKVAKALKKASAT